MVICFFISFGILPNLFMRLYNLYSNIILSKSINIYALILSYTSLYKFIQVYTSLYKFIQVYTSLYKFIQVFVVHMMNTRSTIYQVQVKNCLSYVYKYFQKECLLCIHHTNQILLYVVQYILLESYVRKKY